MTWISTSGCRGAGETPAERLLARFHGPWDGSVGPVFKEYAY